MVNVPLKPLTLDEFLAQPETEPASEYVNGESIQKPMPQGKHSRLQGRFVTTINQVAEPELLALALPELRCTFGGRSLVPDVAVFTWNRIPLDETGDIANHFKAHPDWTIEIVSPQQSYNRVTRNILHCLDHGCEMGWLVDPNETSILVYPSGQQPKILQAESDRLPIPDFLPDLELTVGQIFGWLKPGRPHR